MSGSDGTNRTMTLVEARKRNPPVDANEALRKNLQTQLLEAFSPADIRAMADKLKEQALAGDKKAMAMVMAMIDRPQPAQRIGPVTVDARPHAPAASLPAPARSADPEAEERRVGRARQLAELLRPGPAPRRSLLLAEPTRKGGAGSTGMTGPALSALLAESPDWFREEGGVVRLTERGKADLLGQAAGEEDEE